MIKDFAGPTIYSRGRAYCADGMVQNLGNEQETESIHAEVAGTSGADYRVEICFGTRKLPHLIGIPI